MSLKFHHAVTRPPIRGFLLKEVMLKVSPSASQPRAEAVLKLSPPPCSRLTLSLAALNINTIKTPPLADPASSRIPPPLPLTRIVQLPQIRGNISYEDQLPTKSIEEPSSSSVLEKQAARLVVVRRNKMKKHKLKKLRKRMKFEWAKVRQRRELAKEKLFQAGLVAKIKLAQSFDPAKYAAEKIAEANRKEINPVWHGVRYPDFIIKQLMDEQAKKESEKKADEKRRASMSPYVKDYLKSLPK